MIKEINNNGEFWIRHEGVDVKVMLFSDYAKMKKYTNYELSVKVKNNLIQQLDLGGRFKPNKLIAIEYSKFTIFDNKTITDSNGIFTLRHKGKDIKVQFVEEYFKQNGYKSKQIVEHHMFKSQSIDCIQVFRYSSKIKNINLVIIK